MDISYIRSAIEESEQLSTIPVILKKILEVTSDESSSPEDLYKIILHDQALAKKVLGVANSPFFGHSGRIGDIVQAIMFLGYENIRNIAIGMTVISMFSTKCDVNLKKFWKHSYEVAFIAAMIADTATMVNPGNAFLSGLLHDTGRLLLFNLFCEEYKLIQGTDDLLEKEVSIFGCDHALVSSWMAEKARLPVEQVLAIRHHHSPSKAHEFQDMVSVVALAEAMSRMFSPKIEDDGIWTEEHDAILLELSIKPEDVEDIGRRLKAEDAEIERFLELI